MDERSPWWGEHCSRYRYAAAHVSGRMVLDVATGSGFGADMLAREGAALVVGCDLSVSEVMAARSTFRSPRIHFVPGDATRLPFQSAAFDVVASMETLEHIADGRGFLLEIRRVLRPGGVLVLSTPNAAVTANYARNPFHVREYVRDELEALLKRHFETVAIVGQTLSSAFRVAPFLPGRDVARTATDHVRLVVWKVCNRLPFPLKNGLARSFLGRSFYPVAADYRFELDTSMAHVLVAVCCAHAPASDRDG